MGNGLTATHLSELNPTISNIQTITLKSGSRADFLAPQTYTLTIGGITEDYQIQVQPISRTELRSIVDLALIRKGNAANLNFIDTSKITDMSYVFGSKEYFNGDVSLWDVSSVENMKQMVEYAYFFNQDITSWDVSAVKNMEKMFYQAHRFNQDFSSWDV